MKLVGGRKRVLGAGNLPLVALALVCLQAVYPASIFAGVAAVRAEGDITLATDYGAVPNDSSDDTAAIEEALRRHREVILPRGTYLVADLDIPSGRTVRGYGATVKLLPKQRAMTPVVDLGRNTNIAIVGLTVDGNRDEQDDSPPGSVGLEDDGMHGIRSYGAQHVELRDLVVKSAHTDGLYLSSDKLLGGPTWQESANFTVTSTVFDRNGRQGMSIIAGEDLTFTGVAFRNTGGKPPSAGVDIEPDQPSEHVRNVRFTRCEFSGNDGVGLMTDIMGGELVGLVIEDSEFFDNSSFRWPFDLQVAGRTRGGSDSSIQNVLIERNKIDRNVYIGGSGKTGTAEYHNMVIKNNSIKGKIIVVKLKSPNGIDVLENCIKEGVDTEYGTNTIQPANNMYCE